jgi:hypothetical protein
MGLRRALTVKMALSPFYGAADSGADPFHEQASKRFSLYQQILGGRFRFDSDNEALLGLVGASYGGLPEHHFGVNAPELHIDLRLAPRRVPPRAAEPPPVMLQAGGGLLCGVMDDSNYAIVAPAQCRALVVASEDMLPNPYHLRYELIEFAVFILAARALGLVPLHGACVGRHGHGLLLLGAGGTGKSTLALCSLLQGLDFLAEDAVFVQPQTLLATGVANYLHVRADALEFVEQAAARRWIAQSPIISRRSGVRKFEADLRQVHGSLAASPLRLTGVVFVSSSTAEDPDELLIPLSTEDTVARLRAEQGYAAGQSGWPHFEERITQLRNYELRRAGHPRASAEALRRLLDAKGQA